MDLASQEFIDKLRGQFAGFMIDIQGIEGKLKLIEIHSPERRSRVVEGIAEANHGSTLQIADMISKQSNFLK